MSAPNESKPEASGSHSCKLPLSPASLVQLDCKVNSVITEDVLLEKNNNSVDFSPAPKTTNKQKLIVNKKT